MWSRRFIWGAWLYVALFPVLARSDDLLRGTLEAIADTEAPTLAGLPLWSPPVLARFYLSRDYRLAWERQSELDALLAAVEASGTDGFDPADFHAVTVRRLSAPGVLDGLGRADRLAADIQLTDALLRYVHHIRFGRIDPARVNRGWNHRPPVPADTLVAAMGSVLDSEDPAASLAALAPKPFFYENLKRALAEYGGDARLRDLPQISPGRVLARGDRDPRVAAIREHLRLLGDHGGPPPAEPELFDDALRSSLIAFQHRFGLTADGVAGAATVAALNRPQDPARVDQIRMNLERMRWFYDGLPADYVLVDVAGFMVHVVRGGQVEWSTRVVVGTPKQQTPSFRDEMEHVIFNPTWTVPPSIQKTMRSAGTRFKVVDRLTGRTVRGGDIGNYRRYSLIQEAGPRNALGRVKFIFPNGQAVYLHDTPSKGLFSQSVRAYSHGCVRVQNPLKLAEVILRKPEWGQSEINRVVATNRTRYVHLEEHLPVVLYYLTAMADEAGNVSFRRDIYGRDPDAMQALSGPASEPRIRLAPDPPTSIVPATARAHVTEPSEMPASERRDDAESFPPDSPEPAPQTATPDPTEASTQDSRPRPDDA